MFWFQLGREYKLSIAEILAVFDDIEIVAYEKEVLIIRSILWNNDDLQAKILSYADKLWWSIKIMKIALLKDISFEEKIFEKAEFFDGKFQYWISLLGKRQNLKAVLMGIKKSLKAEKISSRFVNKDFKNLSSAQIIGEKLIKRETDFSLISLAEWSFFWTSIWVQDIYAYSKRDYAKTRDMQVGMLPPKLSQMMINLWKFDSVDISFIYDPFVWLWTILIEAELMWFTDFYGSDLNEKMVKTSSQNVPKAHIEKLNAKFVNEASCWNKVKDWIIITEWFLWEVMTKKNISIDRITEQRKSLEKIYSAFFLSLSTGWFSWTLVICFPFWEMKGKYFYFEEIYSIVEKYCDIVPYFSEKFSEKATKSGSLLYKREKQLVWREIFRLKLK